MKGEKFTIIALIGGVLIVAGSFLPWITYNETTISGWNSFDVLMLSGGILVLLGALTKLGFESKTLDSLIPIGGVLAFVDAVQFYRAKLEVLSVSKGITSLEHGIILSLFGAFLALLGTITVLREE